MIRTPFTPVIAISIIVLSMVSPQLDAQNNGADNAADDYREAIEYWKGMSDSDRDALLEYEAVPGQPVPDNILSALRRAEPMLDALRSGSSADMIDWGINYEDGLETILPHLSPMRNGTLLLAIDAQVRFESGDARGAADSIAAAVRMSDHVTQGPVLISTLVGAAIFRAIDGRVLQQAIDSGALGAREAATVLDSINDILHDDPFRLTESIEGERQFVAQWMIDNFSEPGGKEEFLEDYGPMFSATLDIAPLSQANFEIGIRQVDMALADMGAALQQENLGQAVLDIQDILDKAERGAYGPLAIIMLPAMDKAIESVISVYERIDILKEDLETIIDDPANGAAKVSNAALWYLRAIRMHQAVPARVWSIIETNPADLTTEDRAALHEALPATNEIVSELLAAAEIERCDFDLDHTWKYRDMLVDLSHTDGMIRNGQLLRAHILDLLREPSAENTEQAAALLHAAARMSRHLTTDRRLRSTRASCKILEAAFDVIDRMRQDDTPDDNPDDTPDDTSVMQSEIAQVRDAAPREVMMYDVALRKYREVTSELLIGRIVEGGRGRDTLAQQLGDIARQSSEPHSFSLEPMIYNDAVAAVTELNRMVEQAVSIAQSSTTAIEIEVQIETLKLGYAEHWPPELAAWLLDPLIKTAAAMERIEMRREDTILVYPVEN